jgi:putative addiction module CopG family antidote
MATETPTLASEFEDFAAPLVQSGRYASAKEVLHAAMDALVRSELDDQAFDKACERAAEEGEASGIAEGDVIARLREKHGFGVPVSR